MTLIEEDDLPSVFKGGGGDNPSSWLECWEMHISTISSNFQYW